MQHIDTLLHARWIIPVEPHAVVYENHSLAIHAGRIVAILPQNVAGERFTAATVRRLDEHALIPGLVNAHTHAAMSLLRGLADDLPLMDWLTQHIWPAETRFVSAEFVRDGTELAMAEMLRGGITCFNDMYYFPEVTARAVDACGMRACIGLIVLDFPSAWAQDAAEYLAKGMALHDQYRDHPAIRCAWAPHAPYTVSDAPLERVRVLADELDIPVHMHVHETAHEIAASLAQFGVRPWQRLERLGLVSSALLAVHMTQLEEDEIDAAAAAHAHVLHCPESNLKLASGFCPVHRLQAAGVNVALGTDGSASNNDLDLFGEMRSAALLAKGLAADAAALPAATALRMATLNGAAALGWSNDIGSLSVGKYADVTAVHLGGIESTPLYNPISQLVYATGRHQVTDVWIGGRAMLKDRVLLTLDEGALVRVGKVWEQRLSDAHTPPA